MRTLAAQDGAQGSEYDLHIERERPVLYVVEIQPHHLLKGEVGATAYLPVAGHPRDGPKPPLVLLFHALEVPHRQGSWADQAHLPLEDVYELGQLVDAPSPQETPDQGYPGIVSYLEERTLGLVAPFELLLPPLGVLVHRAEHVAEKDLSVSPDPLLAEEDRPRRVEPDGEGYG